VNARRTKELRRLVNMHPPFKGAIPTSTVIAGKAVIIIKGGSKRQIYRAMKKKYRLAERGSL
jgi:hypothetical protein